MNDPMQRARAPRPLEIRTVEVITGAGRSVALASVRCPVRGRTAAVEECADCGRSAGIAQDVLSRGAWVWCAAAADEAVAGRGERVAHGGPCAAQACEGPPVRLALRQGAVAVRPRLAASTAAAALRGRGHPGAPVVDGEGRPVGWVTEAALLRAGPRATVADAMERSGLAVSEAAPLSRAGALLVARGVERLPVVSDEGVVVGVLSALDLLGWAAARPEQDG